MIRSERSATLAGSCGRALVLSTLLWGSLTGDAHAQSPSAQNSINIAKTLFNNGEDFKRNSMFTEACAVYQASMRIYARAATATKIAECRERDGKLVAALGEYRAALQLGDSAFHTRAQQEREIQASIAAIEQKIARVRVVVVRVEGLQVTSDGVELAGVALESSIEVDPGKHVFVGAAPDRVSDVQNIEVKAGEEKTVLLFLKELTPPPPPAIPVQIPVKLPEPPKTILPMPASPAEDPGRAQRTAGAVFGGLGLLSMGAGVGFGIYAGTLVLHTQQICGDRHCASEEARKEVAAQSNTGRDAALVCAGAGAAAAIIGAVVYGTAPGAPKTGARPVLRAGLAPGYATLQVAW
jgi:hypothetical protein